MSKKIDAWGRVIITSNELFEAIYNGNIDLSDFLVETDEKVIEYNKWCDHFDQSDKKITELTYPDITPEDFHKQNQQQWLMPEAFTEIDVRDFLLSLCNDQKQIDRINKEMDLYEKYKLTRLLQFMIYLVDTMRSNNIWSGCGRGSSVASYALFLIGVHRIDSLRYSLDITEFLK